jgi:membrane associated rhomboid family serine protease
MPPETVETRHCYRHPDRETGLSCSECGRAICYECMTPAPVGLRCPEHSGKPQGVKKVTAAAGRVATGGGGSRSAYPVTIALIAINVGIYLLELAMGGSQNGTANKIWLHGALVGNSAYSDGTPAGVANGEWWRLLTSAFLHAGVFHLATNMLGLYWLGRVLEQLIGSWRYLLLYLASALGGAAGALWLSKPYDVTVGASGAIFGVLGALLVLERRGAINTGGQILALIVLNLLISFLPGISIGGHIGGFIAGGAVMLLYLQFRRSNALALASAVGVAVLSVVLAYAVI